MNKTQTGPRHAVLIDLDNLLTFDHETVRGLRQLATPTQATQWLADALEMAGPADFRLAVGTRLTWLSGMNALLSLGIPGRVCDDGKNAADRQLLEQARHLHRVGFDPITVISGDGIFARLADEGVTLRVVAPSRSCLSQRLAAAADVAGCVTGSGKDTHARQAA